MENTWLTEEGENQEIASAASTTCQSSFTDYLTSNLPASTPQSSVASSLEILTTDPLLDSFNTLTPSEQLQFLSDALGICVSKNTDLDIPQDFLDLALKGMIQLQENGKHNVIYDLCKGLGTPRPDGDDSHFPTKRMPMGLLQYMVQFFVTKPGRKVKSSLFCMLNDILFFACLT